MFTYYYLVRIFKRFLDLCVSISSSKKKITERKILISSPNNPSIINLIILIQQTKIFNKTSFQIHSISPHIQHISPIPFNNLKEKEEEKENWTKNDPRKLRNKKIEIVSKTARQRSSSNRPFFRSTYRDTCSRNIAFNDIHTSRYP